jgi:hypothetical protein
VQLVSTRWPSLIRSSWSSRPSRTNLPHSGHAGSAADMDDRAAPPGAGSQPTECPARAPYCDERSETRECRRQRRPRKGPRLLPHRARSLRRRRGATGRRKFAPAQRPQRRWPLPPAGTSKRPRAAASSSCPSNTRATEGSTPRITKTTTCCRSCRPAAHADLPPSGPRGSAAQRPCRICRAAALPDLPPRSSTVWLVG